MKNRKEILWVALAFIVVGFAFVIWGGVIYHNFPGIKAARVLMRHATWHAGIQYLLGLICLVTGYIYLQKSEK
jgi:uncharacterized membrane protein